MQRKNVVAISLFFIFFLGVTIFVKDPVFTSPEKTLAFAQETKQYTLAEDAYQKLLKKDSANLDYHYGYILNDAAIREAGGDIRSILPLYIQYAASKNPVQHDIGNLGLGWYYIWQGETQQAWDFLQKIQDKHLKYRNYALATICLQENRYADAEKYLVNEIQSQGYTEGACSILLPLYLKTGQIEKADTLLTNYPEIYFSPEDIGTYNLKKGHIARYTTQTFLVKFKQIGYKSGFIILCMTIFGLIYIKRLDLFNPKKWRYLVCLFLSGILLSYGVFFAEKIFDIWVGSHGNFSHDLLYSIFRIGFLGELIKLIPFLILLYATKQVNTSIDYIVYPAVSALGYGLCEYFYWTEGGIGIIHGSLLSSLLLHIICSSFVGYGMYFGIGKKEKPKVLLFLVLIVFVGCIHGLYAFGVYETNEIGTLLSAVILSCGVLFWNTCVNNALNFTVTEKDKGQDRQYKNREWYLICVLWGMLLLEYMYTSIQYGAYMGNTHLIWSIVSGSYLLLFLSDALSVFLIKRNYKAQFKLFHLRSAYFDAAVGEKIEIRPFQRDTYQIFPRCGEILYRERIQLEKNWYMIKLKEPISQLSFCREYILLQPKQINGNINRYDKTMVGIYLLKDYSVFYKKEKTKKDLIFFGWAGVGVISELE